MTVPAIFLTGKRVSLRPLCEADGEGPYLGWFNDPEVCRGNTHHVFPYTREAALAYIRHVREARQDLVLAIVRNNDGAHVGNIALASIHPIYRTAELTIVIGDKECWGQGIGKEACQLLCAHGFSALNLHRISCGTFEDNSGMNALAVALGMKPEGRRRQAAFKAGRYVDLIEYGLLRDEFIGNTNV